MIISTIGLGKLGYPMSEFLSSSGAKVRVYDNNREYVNNLKQKKINFFENGLTKYQANGNDIVYCDTIGDAISNSDICFITVPTPSMQNGEFANKYILNVLEDISKQIQFLKSKKNYKPIIININSTVSPGSFENELIPFMNKYNLKLNLDYFFVYNPYFVALGNVINNLESPDIILCGSSSVYTAKTMKRFYNSIYENPNIKVMTLQEAEIVKLSVNAFLTLKISYSNTLVNFLKKKKNIDPVRVLDAIGDDQRVGKKFLMPGGPFSGPCLPRDTVALKSMMRGEQSPEHLIDSIEKTNKDTLNSLFNDFKFLKKKHGFSKFGFLGLGYRPNTSNIDDSYAIKLYDMCVEEGLTVNYLDHYLENGIRKNQVFSEKELVQKSDVLFLSYVDFKNRNLLSSDLYKNVLIFDIWSQFKEKKTNRIFNKVIDLEIKNTKSPPTKTHNLRVIT